MAERPSCRSSSPGPAAMLQGAAGSHPPGKPGDPYSERAFGNRIRTLGFVMLQVTK